MAATASGEPRKCQLTLPAVSHMSCNYAGKEEQDGWMESTNPFLTACLTSAAQGLLLTEVLLFSMTLCQVLFHVPGCK